MTTPKRDPRRARPAPALPRPRKRLGQHFLSDPRILDRIADAAALGPSDTVLEIGPGRGALTDRLAERAGRVIAIELDGVLAAALRERYAGRRTVRVVEGDVLDLDLAAVAGGPFVLAGNVPYYITTPIIFRALEVPLVTRAVFLVQREVAERAAAGPGTKRYGALSVDLQVFATVELLFGVGAGAFHPRPSVESAVVRIVRRPSPAIAAADARAFRDFVQDVFALRRKQMRRVVRTLMASDAAPADRVLVRAAVAPAERPENLAPEAFVRLFEAMRAEGRAAGTPR